MAVTSALRPVRAPAATPAEDSMYAVTVDVPSSAPSVVPAASAMKARPARSSFPSRTNPAWAPTRTKVPTVSNSTMNRKIKTTGAIEGLKSAARSSFNRTGAIEGGKPTMPVKGMSPVATPAAVVARMPNRIAPGAFRTCKPTVRVSLGRGRCPRTGSPASSREPGAGPGSTSGRGATPAGAAGAGGSARSLRACDRPSCDCTGCNK